MDFVPCRRRRVGLEDGGKALVAEMGRRHLEGTAERRHGKGWSLPEPDKCRAEIDVYKEAEPELCKELHAKITARIRACRGNGMHWKDPVKQPPLHRDVYALKSDLSANMERRG
eukprot:6426085-Prymnesium_polylepis.1